MSQDFDITEVTEAEPEKKMNVWLIVGIVAVVIVLLSCCCITMFLAFPTLLGPAIGNVFSNIVEGL